MRLSFPIIAGLVLLTGCVQPMQMAAYPAPPPLPAEVIPLPPVSETPLIWQPGDWAYTGGSYRFDGGHYVPAAGHGRQWVFAQWAPGLDGNPAWVPGHWI